MGEDALALVERLGGPAVIVGHSFTPDSAVLRGYGIEGEDLVDAARALRSAMHGFALLEAAGGFGLPRHVDRSYEAMLDAFDAMLERWGERMVGSKGGHRAAAGRSPRRAR